MLTQSKVLLAGLAVVVLGAVVVLYYRPASYSYTQPPAATATPTVTPDTTTTAYVQPLSTSGSTTTSSSIVQTLLNEGQGEASTILESTPVPTSQQLSATGADSASANSLSTAE